MSSPTIEAYLERYGNELPLAVALKVCTAHGISKEDFKHEFGITDSVNTEDFFRWLGY